jgi:phosphate transport system ATP-binding protein
MGGDNGARIYCGKFDGGVLMAIDKMNMNKSSNDKEGSNLSEKDIVFDTKELNLWYGEDQALKNINLEIPENEVTAIIGPSGCGKSTYIKTLNRMIELIPTVKTSGTINYRGKNILDKSYKVEDLRTNVGMVFQKPNPFPKSIYENIVYGPKIHGIRNKKVLDEIVEKSLRGAAIWDEVKDRLKENAYGLSGGQQQRICIARCLAIEPDVILMDEPTSALDPISTLKVEELVQELKKEFSIVIVTHNMQQAARISDKTAFFLSGEVVEFDETNKIFSTPSDKRTEDYITGRFG